MWGQLLYPAVDQNLDLNFKINGFEIKVTSVDLNQHWQVIEEKLLSHFQLNLSILHNHEVD